MRTVRTKVYKFNELSADAQQKAIEQLSDINVDYGWWQSVYEDAENIGVKITNFDLYHGTIGGNIVNSLNESCELIIANHGDHFETYKTAKAFLAEWAKLVAEHSDGVDTQKVCEDKEYEFDELANELENQFKKSILEDYIILLQKEYDYLTSREAIIESIIANEYEFTVNGKQF